MRFQVTVLDDQFQKLLAKAFQRTGDLTVPLTIISGEWFKGNKSFVNQKSLLPVWADFKNERVKKALQVKNIDPVTQNQVNDLEYNAAIKYLEGLKDGSIILPDAPRIEIASSNQKVFHNMVPPIFNKDKVQW